MLSETSPEYWMREFVIVRAFVETVQVELTDK